MTDDIENAEDLRKRGKWLTAKTRWSAKGRKIGLKKESYLGTFSKRGGGERNKETPRWQEKDLAPEKSPE